MFWFDKNNPDVLFLDIREESHILSDGRPFTIKPDLIMDFRKLELPDGIFSLVVFDPPHMERLGANSWMAKKYGVLGDGWRDDIRAGFDECLRVLKPGGTLIFKWSEAEIRVSEVIEAIGHSPLFGHTTRVRKGASGSIWMAFVKGVGGA